MTTLPPSLHFAVNRHGNSMYSWPMRLNCMFGYFTTLVLAFAFFVGFSSRFLQKPSPSVSLEVNQIKLY
jgi:hypothetical protein